jgi:apocytochrome f
VVFFFTATKSTIESTFERTLPTLLDEPRVVRGQPLEWVSKLFSIVIGGNRGRGQVYPTGEKSNNGAFNASVSGQVSAISSNDKGGSTVSISAADGSSVDEVIPAGPELLIKVGDSVTAGVPLTSDPNVGGFGQIDAEVVLQNPVRIYGLLAFLAAVAIAQIMLVLKKRQIEKVQAAEGV